jgi:hypothetical protein
MLAPKIGAVALDKKYSSQRLAEACADAMHELGERNRP